jgi:hypothetical protein
MARQKTTTPIVKKTTLDLSDEHLNAAVAEYLYKFYPEFKGKTIQVYSDDFNGGATVEIEDDG